MCEESWLLTSKEEIFTTPIRVLAGHHIVGWRRIPFERKVATILDEGFRDVELIDQIGSDGKTSLIIVSPHQCHTDDKTTGNDILEVDDYYCLLSAEMRASFLGTQMGFQQKNPELWIGSSTFVGKAVFDFLFWREEALKIKEKIRKEKGIISSLKSPQKILPS
ncbi:hypothetical protein KA071_03605 [Candidatus Gracilibacteria bacterium]|nr:hypothetical protein [Candidatus Gracilibacteria bacterium]